jgi:hypothetical protein
VTDAGVPRILVVEDDPEIAYLLRAVLADGGREVRITGRGEEAVRGRSRGALEELSFRRYPRLGDLIARFGIAALENLGYRQINTWWRVKGTYSALRGRKGWGKMTRRGFTMAHRGEAA